MDVFESMAHIVFMQVPNSSPAYIHVVARVFFREDCFLFVHGDAGVNLRGRDGAVAQHFLDIADVHICF